MDELNKFLGAGLRHGWIKDKDGVTYDINAIISIEGDNEQEDTEIPGDDETKMVISSNRRETITITANGLTFDVIAAITGNSVSSSATGKSIPLGTQSELNAPFVEVGGVTNGRTEEGTAVKFTKIFHKCQLNNVVVNQENATEFSVEISGTAFQTDKDIEGGSLVPKRTSTIEVEEGQQD